MGWTRNLEAAGTADIAFRAAAPVSVRARRLEPGEERDRAILATGQHPFPANIVYRLARRHIRAVGDVLRGRARHGLRWQMLYLSQVIGRPVRDTRGEPIGKVADLIVAVGERYPPVTGLVVATDRRKIFLPWSSVASLDASGARLNTSTLDIAKFSSARTRSCSRRT